MKGAMLNRHKLEKKRLGSSDARVLLAGPHLLGSLLPPDSIGQKTKSICSVHGGYSPLGHDEQGARKSWPHQQDNAAIKHPISDEMKQLHNKYQPETAVAYRGNGTFSAFSCIT